VEKKKVNSRNRELTRKERRDRTENTNIKNEEMKSEERGGEESVRRKRRRKIAEE
jgi:hypothetical protein